MIGCSGPGQSNCPSRYLCYPSSSEEESKQVEEAYNHICLCNKMMLFHGESCEKSSLLGYISSIIMVTHGLYVLVIIVCMIRSLYRRRCAKNLMAAPVLCLLVGLTAFSIYNVNFVRMYSDFDDRSWETNWQPKLVSLFTFLASLNVATMGQIFLWQLQAVGVIRGKMASVWRLATGLVYVVAAFTGCFLIFISRSVGDILIYLVPSISCVACLMAQAALQTQRYLSSATARYAGRRAQLTTVNNAQQQLFRFVKAFCFWLGICCVCAISIWLFQCPIMAGYSRPSLNLLQLGMTLSLNQLGLVESDYFLLPDKRPKLGVIGCLFFIMSHLNFVDIPESNYGNSDDLASSAIQAAHSSVMMHKSKPFFSIKEEEPAHTSDDERAAPHGRQRRFFSPKILPVEILPNHQGATSPLPSQKVRIAAIGGQTTA